MKAFENRTFHVELSGGRDNGFVEMYGNYENT